MTKKKTTTPIKKNVKHKTSDEVIISAPKEPITKAVTAPGAMDTQKATPTPGEPAIPQAPKIDIFTKEFCGALWEMLFSRLAATKGEHWKLTEAETLTIGETTSAVANRYIGELLGDYPELAALGISAVIITAPRVMKDGKIKRTAKQLADRTIQEMGSKQDLSLPSVPTGQKQPGTSS